MFSMVKSAGIFGINSYMIEIEADVSGGLPSFDVVGLPDTAVKAGWLFGRANSRKQRVDHTL